MLEEPFSMQFVRANQRAGPWTATGLHRANADLTRGARYAGRSGGVRARGASVDDWGTNRGSLLAKMLGRLRSCQFADLARLSQHRARDAARRRAWLGGPDQVYIFTHPPDDGSDPLIQLRSSNGIGENEVDLHIARAGLTPGAWVCDLGFVVKMFRYAVHHVVELVGSERPRAVLIDTSQRPCDTHLHMILGHHVTCLHPPPSPAAREPR